MSIDRSLKTASTLSRHRNVLTRAERVAKLEERGKFDKTKHSALGLVKVGNRKVAAGGKTEKKKEEGAEGAAPAAGGKAAAPAKGAAPAAKAAAPAKK